MSFRNKHHIEGWIIAGFLGIVMSTILTFSYISINKEAKHIKIKRDNEFRTREHNRWLGETHEKRKLEIEELQLIMLKRKLNKNRIEL